MKVNNTGESHRFLKLRKLMYHFFQVYFVVASCADLDGFVASLRTGDSADTLQQTAPVALTVYYLEPTEETTFASLWWSVRLGLFVRYFLSSAHGIYRALDPDVFYYQVCRFLTALAVAVRNACCG